MSLNVKDIIGNIFYTDTNAKAEEQKKYANLQQKTNNVFGRTTKPTVKTINPFLNKNGELINPNLNYQKLLDNPKIAQRTKQYIAQATGLTPTVTTQNTVVPSDTKVSGNSAVQRNTVLPSTGNTYKATSNTIADAAKKYVGTPYVWGGESMEEGGMDCSGFVYNALKDAGYDVGRTTAQGYRSYGSSVNKADLQAGDLIFYGRNGEASHIGIYLGNGQVIHSSGGSKNTKANPGKGVIISNVDHRSDFIEARRY